MCQYILSSDIRMIYMKLKNKLFLLGLLSLLSSFNTFCIGQENNTSGVLLIDGLVYGYNQDSGKGFLKKEKKILLEGTLSGVLIAVSENDKPIYKTRTSKKGEFLLKVNFGKVYKIEFLKSGFKKIILLVDTKDIPQDLSNYTIPFSGMELILNNYKQSDTSQINIPFGKLFYNKRAKFIDFEANQPKTKKGLFAKHEDQGTLIYLMKHSVLKNKGNISALQKEKSKDGDQSNYIPPISSTPPTKTISELKLSSFQDINLSENNLKDRESEIRKARKELEEAKLTMITKGDSLLIEERDNLLNKAITDLETAKKFITLQKEEISNQRKLLFLSTGSVILLSIFLFIIYIQYKENRKTGFQLKDKNKKITDSINYAKRIQQSILPQENEIQKLLPHSFVFYQPRDIVSGDFYWFSELEDKIIIAAVDCTGHGVPGAFMSLIGNTLLNGIINEKRIVDPSSILSLLHSEVLKALRQQEGDNQSQDGMEMSLCVIDNKKKIIEFAGAMTPIYVVNDNILDVVQPDSKEIGGINSVVRKNKKIEFTTTQIPIQKNMCVYMFTDGYMDQFGGKENKKFNTLNFKSLLLNIQEMDMNKQKQAIELAMKDWKGNYRQIDDMLVIGIKF